MRPNKRDEILDAAAQVIEAQGLTAVTFDSVAAESGITRSGILYHFRSREDLIQGLHEHLATGWERAMEAESGGRPATDLTATERLTAYIRVCGRSVTRSELQMMLEATTRPENYQPWHDVIARWTPDATSGASPVTHTLALLAADGLWIRDALSPSALPEATRKQLAERLVELVADS